MHASGREDELPVRRMLQGSIDDLSKRAHRLAESLDGDLEGAHVRKMPVRRRRRLDARDVDALVGRGGEDRRPRQRSRPGCAPAARRCSAASSRTRSSSTCGPCSPISSPTSPVRSSTRSRATTSTRTDAALPGELRVVATAGHVDHGKSSLIVRLTGHGPGPMGGGEAPRAHDRPRVRVVHAPVRPRDRLRGRPRPRTVHRQHARRRRAGAPGAVRGGGRRRVEAAVRGAPADPRRPRRSRRGDRPHEARPRRRRDARDRRPTRSASAWPAPGCPARRSCPCRPRPARASTRWPRRWTRCWTRPGPAEDARTRLHIDRVFTIKGAGTVVTGTLAGGCIDVGDEVEVLPDRHPCAHPLAADPQAGGGTRVSRLARRGEPGRASSANGSGVATCSRCRRRGDPRASSTHDCDPCAV